MKKLLLALRCSEPEGENYRFDDELIVPIIENTPFEEDLKVRRRRQNSNFNRLRFQSD
jgi:hypothetical protein